MKLQCPTFDDQNCSDACCLSSNLKFVFGKLFRPWWNRAEVQSYTECMISLCLFLVASLHQNSLASCTCFFFPRTLSHCRPSVSLTLCPVCHELFDGSPRANHMTESIVQANFRVHSFDQHLRIQAIHHHHHASAMNQVVHDGHHR